MAIGAITTGISTGISALGGPGEAVDKIGSVGSTVGGLFDGGGTDTVPVPEDLPSQPQTGGPRAGTAYKHTRLRGPDLPLHIGLYNYDDLSRRGLHDELSSVRVKSGFTVRLFADVEGGQPGGQEIKVTGPKTVNLHKRGMGDRVSAIIVQRASDRGGSSRPGTETVELPGGFGVNLPDSSGTSTPPIAGGQSPPDTSRPAPAVQEQRSIPTMVWVILAGLAAYLIGNAV